MPSQPQAGEAINDEETIMKNAAIAVLLGALSGTALANTANETGAPKGYVTIQEIPVILVEAKRWTGADEAAFQNAQRVVAQAETKAGLMHRLIAYVGR
jgi:hypothetical protein